jgi:hypothetical protein
MKPYKFFFSLFISLVWLSADSQTLTTYYTNFDTPTAQAGWTQYRKGSVSANGWGFDINGYTTPTCLAHYYPVTSSAPTDDWYVSPAFSFGAGGKIDSLRTNFSGFGTPQTGDTIAIFLLAGSANPSQATKRVKLVEFKGTDYVNDGVWKLKTNISIPAQSGQSYIAFKYYTPNSNWLDVKYDNLRVKINSTVGLSPTKKDDSQISAFPNPVKDKLVFNSKLIGNLNEQLHLKVYNTLGELVLNSSLMFGEVLNPTLENGVYVYQLTDSNHQLLKCDRIIIRND